MAVITLNEIRYKKLLSRAMPKVIETGKEDERMAAELERLDRLGRALMPEGATTRRTDDPPYSAI